MIRLYVSDGVQLFQESSKEVEYLYGICNISPVVLHTRFVRTTIKCTRYEP